MRVDGPCIYCQAPHSLILDADALMRFRAGGFAKDCFPELSADQREFLISGICGKCWDELFAEDEDAAVEAEDD